MRKPILSVIMPMYNSRDMSTNIYEAIRSLEKVTKDYEIILVDDGSTNNCRAEAEKINNKSLKVVGYAENRGKGNAIKYGFRFVSGAYIAFVDSGRDINPSQLLLFLSIMKQKNADIVIGSKRHPESKVHYPFARRFMSRIYQLLNKILFNLDIKDTQVGIKLFRYDVLSKIMPKIAIKRFAFDLELLVIAHKIHAKIIEAPVTIRYKFHSTISVKEIFWILWDTAAIFYRDKILHHYG